MVDDYLDLLTTIKEKSKYESLSIFEFKIMSERFSLICEKSERDHFWKERDFYLSTIFLHDGILYQLEYEFMHILNHTGIFFIYLIPV
jgi:hypothetical protein